MRAVTALSHREIEIITRSPILDLEQARRHLALLDPTTDRHLWLATDDTDRKRRPKQFAGRLDHLRSVFEPLQSEGFAIHVAVNAMRRGRRRNVDTIRIRAIYAELDVPPVLPFPLLPSLRIQTSQGKQHCYWLINSNAVPAVAEATAMQAAIVEQFGADRNAKDVARVLRLAGTLHQKDGAQRVQIVDANGMRYTRHQLQEAFPPPRSPVRPVIEPPKIVRSDRYLQAVITGVVADLSQAVEGTRNGSLNRAAFRLGQFGINLGETIEILSPAALAIGLSPTEIVATVRSGVRAGAAQLRGRKI